MVNVGKRALSCDKINHGSKGDSGASPCLMRISFFDKHSCPIRLAVEGHYSRMLSPFESAEMTPAFDSAAQA